VHLPELRDDTQPQYERLLKAYLSTELRLVNSGLPRSRSSLSELLKQVQPQIPCTDGSQQMIKRSELKYLSSLLDAADRKSLMLPILIEMTGDQSGAIVMCPGSAEQKVVSSVLGMHLECERPGQLRIYKPQLALLRRKLKTTTQYMFSTRTGD
jgi:uncharacterized protein (UPF0216 family)